MNYQELKTIGEIRDFEAFPLWRKKLTVEGWIRDYEAIGGRLWAED